MEDIILQNMKVKLKLNPGERGRRVKTVETIIEEIPWKAPPKQNEIVLLATKRDEKDIHLLIRNAGGKWDKKNKVWKISYGDAAAIGLKSRIVDEND